MPGRRDWGALTSAALTDRRFRELAKRLTDDPELLVALALVTARGLMPHLGLWAVRETDEGVLPDNGIEATMFATGLPPSMAEKVVALLQAPGVELLKPRDDGLYLAGFLETYEPLVRARKLARDRVARARDRTRAEEREEAKGSSEGGGSSSSEATGVPDESSDPAGYANRSGSKTNPSANRSRNKVTVTNPPSNANDGGIGYANDSRTRFDSGRTESEEPPLPPQGGEEGEGAPLAEEPTGPATAPRLVPPPLDPRTPLPPEVRSLLGPSPPIAGGGGPGGNGSAPLPRGVALPAEPRDAFIAEVHLALEKLRVPWALTSKPMLSAWIEQIDMLRQGRASPIEVATALRDARHSALPSEAFRALRKTLARR